ncbi:MAG: ROK family protein [Chloroflexi bacterium]|nr:MAG: ROK family protein [Chloroflexota bacterium]
MQSLRCIAVDLGGTQIRAARYTVAGVLEARVSMPTSAQEGVVAVSQRIKSVIRQVWPPEIPVAGIGIGLPGILDYKRGIVLKSPNLPGWLDVPLRDKLLDAFHVPVFMGNDMHLAALAEHRFGAGHGVSNMVYLALGAGIGGGMILNDTLFTGGHGMGAEIGHVTLDMQGPRCHCGRRGCLEMLASGAAIARHARECLERGDDSLLRALVDGDLSQITAQEVGIAAQQGDALAQAVFTEAGRYIGMALVNLMYLLNPDLFVLGGDVLRAGDVLLSQIQETVTDLAPDIYREQTRIVPAALWEDVGLWGALALVLMELDL